MNRSLPYDPRDAVAMPKRSPKIGKGFGEAGFDRLQCDSFEALLTVLPRLSTDSSGSVGRIGATQELRRFFDNIKQIFGDAADAAFRRSRVAVPVEQIDRPARHRKYYGA